MSERIGFRYKPLLGHWSPMATLGLFLNDVWHRADFYVDSGVTHSIVHADFAHDVGFEISTGIAGLVKVGDGSLIPVFLHNVPLCFVP